MYRSLTVSLMLCALLLAELTSAALAQESTPLGDFVIPDPTECLVEPRTLESVTSLAGAPVAMPQASPSLEGAEPADEDVVDAVTAIAEESVACFNAGNFLAQFAFYTDEAILAIMPPGLTAEDLAGFLGTTPEPLPEEMREAVMVRDVMVHPNGEVTAYFLMQNPEGVFTTLVTLEKQGEKYVITSDVEVSEEMATPAA